MIRSHFYYLFIENLLSTFKITHNFSKMNINHRFKSLKCIIHNIFSNEPSLVAFDLLCL
jgi:hypothetical protein